MGNDELKLVNATQFEKCSAYLTHLNSGLLYVQFDVYSG